MSDLVERLRNAFPHGHENTDVPSYADDMLMHEAAAEIERLQERLKGSDMLAHVRGDEIERLRAGNEKLKIEVWHLQAVNGTLKIALREARRVLEEK